YFSFKDAYVLAEADNHYLFNKCHEALRSMDCKVAEINESIGSLEGFKSRGWMRNPTMTRVQIEKIENSESSYMLKLNVDIIKDNSISNEVLGLLVFLDGF